MKNNELEKLVLKKRGEDGTKVITIRIRENLLADIDATAQQINYSRNELICAILQHGINNIEIQ